MGKMQFTWRGRVFRVQHGVEGPFRETYSVGLVIAWSDITAAMKETPWKVVAHINYQFLSIYDLRGGFQDPTVINTELRV
jgi:hypothetical protein